VIFYTVPGELTPRQVLASPAQVTPANALPATELSKLLLKGTGLGGGTFELLIIHPRWAEPAVANPVDWELVRTADHTVAATVRETATLQTALTPVDILPGLYGAQVSLSVTRATSAGIKTFIQKSNQFPFLIAPRINSITPATGIGGDTFTVNVYIVQHPDLLPADVQVYLGEDLLLYRPGGALNAGEFKITASNLVELRAPAILATGLVPVRVLINGVESCPRWITGL
jgi:hypothetical protein